MHCYNTRIVLFESIISWHALGGGFNFAFLFVSNSPLCCAVLYPRSVRRLVNRTFTSCGKY
jgi:hypothetical protein